MGMNRSKPADNPARPPGSATGRQASVTAGTDEKRERIVSVAAQLFFEQGYANTTIASIARTLGVTKPFVYYYFGDKQELFEAICWPPTVACLTAMNFAADDSRPAHEKLAAGIEKLVRATIAHHPAATLPYREPQAFSNGYRAAMKNLAQAFYRQMAALLEAARREGHAQFDDARITARAAASIPGFLFNWYRPGGRFDDDALVEQLSRITMRAAGLDLGRGEQRIARRCPPRNRASKDR